jgi:hypothetical protein
MPDNNELTSLNIKFFTEPSILNLNDDFSDLNC